MYICKFDVYNLLRVSFVELVKVCRISVFAIPEFTGGLIGNQMIRLILIERMRLASAVCIVGIGFLPWENGFEKMI